jgi:Arc/MetJ-type ribon-helix-helix transcriptional regulator
MDEAERAAIRAMLRRRAEQQTQTKAQARRWLIGEGLYSEAGDLKPQFGGEPDEGDHH